jgi:putative transposase
MQLLTFGTRLQLKQIEGHAVTLMNTATGETRTTTLSQLVTSFHGGQITIENQSGLHHELARLAPSEVQAIRLRTESQAAVKRMLAIRSWLEALRQAGIERVADEPWVRTVVKKLQDGDLKTVEKLSIRTLALHERQVHLNGGDWTQLIPHFSHRGGKGKIRIDERADAIISNIIEKLKTQSGRIVKTEIYQSVLAQVNSHNIAHADNQILAPGAATVCRRISNSFSAYELCARSNGKKYADRLYRRNAEARDKADIPLLVVEFDDLDTGVFLVDDRTGLPFGRGYITHGIDRATDSPLGFSVGHESRSYESAMGAIVSCLLPKKMSDPMFSECKFAWEPYGHPGQILQDNATYNFSSAMCSQSQQLRLLLAGARAYGPTEKNSIERFNRVCKQDLLPTLLGWRGDKTNPDAVKNGLASAIMTSQELRRTYTKWVTDVYMNSPRDDGTTTRERWLKYFDKHSPAVRWTGDQVATLRLRPTTLRFRASGGLARLGLRYSSPALYKLREKLGLTASVVALTDHADLSYLKVINPTNKDVLHVPCVSPKAAFNGLNEYQHSLILKMARSKGKNSLSVQDLVNARQELAEMTSQLVRSRRLKDRKAAARTGVVASQESIIESDSAEKSIDVPDPRVTTELEYEIEQLSLVELDQDMDMEGWVVA